MNNREVKTPTMVEIKLRELEEKRLYADKQKEWSNKMPYLNFKEDWDVAIIPPFGGAMARFLVRKNDREVSVYFDYGGCLSATREPHWEVYRTKGGKGKDVYRWLLGEEKQMLNHVKQLLGDD